MSLFKSDALFENPALEHLMDRVAAVGVDPAIEEVMRMGEEEGGLDRLTIGRLKNAAEHIRGTPAPRRTTLEEIESWIC